MAPPLIAVDGVTLAARGGGEPRAVLRGVSLAVGAGETVALAGPLGAGKTTLLAVAAGLLRPDAGAVRLDGEDVWAASAARRRALRRGLLSFVPQGGALDPDLTLAGQIAQPLRLAGLGRRDRGARVANLIAQAGLGDAAALRPAEAGADARALAAAARALTARPRVVLADEPAAGASDEAIEAVLRLLATVSARHGAVLIATDDADLAARAGRVAAIEDGVVAEAAPSPPVRLAGPPRARDATA